MTFEALVLEQEGGRTTATVRALEESSLPQGDVTVRVEYSTLNYKDALAITGRAPIVRSWPMVPGIDFAGTVEASSDAGFKPATASCSMAGGWARPTGAGWPSAPACRRNSWFRCRSL